MVPISQLTSSSCFYQVTIYTKRSKYHPCPPAEALDARTHMFTNGLSLSEVPRWLQMVWQASKMHWRSVSSFSVAAEYTSVFKCPYRLKSKGQRSGKRGGCTTETNCLWTHIIRPLFPCFWCDRLLKFWSSILDTLCIFPLYQLKY